MLRLRQYKEADASTILSWCKDEVSFCKWTAGLMGDYPISEKEFEFVSSLMAFTAFDENGIIGFFTLRSPREVLDELRFGFVIVDPKKAGQGYGKEMIQLGLKFVFEIYKAKKASLGVFENNMPAYYCYKAVGFNEINSNEVTTYNLLNEKWNCIELIIER